MMTRNVASRLLKSETNSAITGSAMLFGIERRRVVDAAAMAREDMSAMALLLMTLNDVHIVIALPRAVVGR